MVIGTVRRVCMVEVEYRFEMGKKVASLMSGEDEQCSFFSIYDCD
jgi:hypothetical protein